MKPDRPLHFTTPVKLLLVSTNMKFLAEFDRVMHLQLAQLCLTPSGTSLLDSMVNRREQYDGIIIDSQLQAPDAFSLAYLLRENAIQSKIILKIDQANCFTDYEAHQAGVDLLISSVDELLTYFQPDLFAQRLRLAA